MIIYRSHMISFDDFYDDQIEFYFGIIVEMSPRKSSETFCYFVATFFIHTVYKKREMIEKRARCIYFNVYKHTDLYNGVHSIQSVWC